MELKQLGGRFVAVSMLRRAGISRESTDTHLHHGQLPLLQVVIATPGCTQQEIATRLRVTPASVAQSTKRLEAAGLLEKSVDKDDLRCNRLYATAKGIERSEKMRETLQRIDERTFAGFSDAELCQLALLFDRMIENLKTGDEPMFMLCPDQEDKC